MSVHRHDNAWWRARSTRLWPLLLVVLCGLASAQTSLKFTLRPPSGAIYAGDHPRLTLVVRNAGTVPKTFSANFCPQFAAVNVNTGKVVRVRSTVCPDILMGTALKPGEQLVQEWSVPAAFPSGSYRVKAAMARYKAAPDAEVVVWPGPPLLATLSTPGVVLAGRPFRLTYTYRNLSQQDVAVAQRWQECGQELRVLILNDRGQVVFGDPAPAQACPTVPARMETLRPGTTYELSRELKVKLEPGGYTAVVVSAARGATASVGFTVH